MMEFEHICIAMVAFCVSWFLQWFMRCLAWDSIDAIANVLTVVSVFVAVIVGVLWYVGTH